MAERLAAFFLPAAQGSRFCLYHPPAGGTVSRGVVYVHPFGEEMNKARRMAALQSGRLAAAGHAVLAIDLLGCGDSSGGFGDARWEDWKRDVRRAVEWLRERGAETIRLWGLRLGGLLAADVACEAAAGIEDLVLWQPVANGEQFLTQFLRLQLAAEMLTGGAAQTGVRELRAALGGGASLEIAGYRLHPDLAAAIDKLKLGDLKPTVRRVHWLEASAQPEPAIMPASERVLNAWRAHGLHVKAVAVAGEPFWSTFEITECPALLDATDAAVNAGH